MSVPAPYPAAKAARALLQNVVARGTDISGTYEGFRVEVSDKKASWTVTIQGLESAPALEVWATGEESPLFATSFGVDSTPGFGESVLDDELKARIMELKPLRIVLSSGCLVLRRDSYFASEREVRTGLEVGIQLLIAAQRAPQSTEVTRDAGSAYRADPSSITRSSQSKTDLDEFHTRQRNRHDQARRTLGYYNLLVPFLILAWPIGILVLQPYMRRRRRHQALAKAIGPSAQTRALLKS